MASTVSDPLHGAKMHLTPTWYTLFGDDPISLETCVLGTPMRLLDRGSLAPKCVVSYGSIQMHYVTWVAVNLICTLARLR